MSAYRARPTRPAQVLVVGNAAVGVGNGTAALVQVIATFTLGQIMQALLNSTGFAGNTQGGAAGTSASWNVYGNADPAIFDFSIAGILVTTPANVNCYLVQIGTQDLGVGLDINTTGIMFAEFLKFTTALGTGLKVAALSQPAAPGVIPLTGDVTIGVQTSALLGANQTVTVQLAIWATPRKDLK